MEELMNAFDDLCCGPHVNTVNLMDAITGQRVDLFAYLMRRGVNVNGVFGRQTPLLAAIDMGHFGMVTMLVSAGADVNAVVRTEDDGFSPLTRALVRCNPSIVRLLIREGADVNMVDYCHDNCRWLDRDHATALDYAIEYEADLDVVRTLLDAGANVNGGAWALEHAVRKRRSDVVQLLIESGADVNPSKAKRDRHWQPRKPLECAIIYDVGEEIIGILIAGGADVNDGNTSAPLSTAVDTDNLAAVLQLIEAGANCGWLKWSDMMRALAWCDSALLTKFAGLRLTGLLQEPLLLFSVR